MNDEPHRTTASFWVPGGSQWRVQHVSELSNETLKLLASSGPNAVRYSPDGKGKSGWVLQAVLPVFMLMAVTVARMLALEGCWVVLFVVMYTV